MGSIEELYEDLETDLSLEAFRSRVAEKVEEMGGLADDETAAMLVAHEIEGDRPVAIDAVQPEMEAVTVLGVVQHIDEIRTFERDDGTEGAVLNIELADESGTARAAFWDEMATAADEDLDRGDTLRLKARPREGFNGLELSVTDIRLEEDLEVSAYEPETVDIATLEPGEEGVAVAGEVLRVESIRTFERDDGSEGRVATVVIGDATGSVTVSAWDGATEYLEGLAAVDACRIVGGNVRERDGRTELHIGTSGRIEPIEDEIVYEPHPDAIAGLSEGDTATISGIVRSTDPVRTFDRSDGSEGKVRNVRLQDETDSIRVALWGDRAELELAPGDPLTCIDVTIQEGYRDDIEASANWQSTIVSRRAPPADEPDETVEKGVENVPEGPVEFTGTVVQPGDPIILDNGEETVKVDYHGDVTLGQRVVVSGTRTEDRIEADSVEPATQPH